MFRSLSAEGLWLPSGSWTQDLKPARIGGRASGSSSAVAPHREAGSHRATEKSLTDEWRRRSSRASSSRRAYASASSSRRAVESALATSPRLSEPAVDYDRHGRALSIVCLPLRVEDFGDHVRVASGELVDGYPTGARERDAEAADDEPPSRSGTAREGRNLRCGDGQPEGGRRQACPTPARQLA